MKNLQSGRAILSLIEFQGFQVILGGLKVVLQEVNFPVNT